MKISKGVEWACHAVALMSALPDKMALRADALARYHELPAAYMAKQLQAMSKAGIIKSSRGTKGGYRLAKSPSDISLWDITAAIEGNSYAFTCTEIRQNGPCAISEANCRMPCSIAASFHAAEIAFRERLKSVSLMSIALQMMQEKSGEEVNKTVQWISNEAVEV